MRLKAGNIFDYCTKKNIGCILISLDQSKAFDRVSHELLFNTLHAFGFDPDFMRSVRVLYTSRE